MRYARFRYRHTRFISLAQINQALTACVEAINNRRHTRFGVFRRERFESIERATSELRSSRCRGVCVSISSHHFVHTRTRA